MKKHAYLIMAHNEFDILEKLISLLDYEFNDIYVHIDKKVKNFDFSYFKCLVKKSNIYFINSINVRWGHFSQIKCEIELLRNAIDKKYEYYHLLSGVDLPLKSQHEIHEFFIKNKGKEFVHFCSESEVSNIKFRVLNYNFVKYNKIKYIGVVFNFINKIAGFIQRIIKIKRKWENDIAIKYGSNWFSISYDLAKYVVDKEEWIKKRFKYSLCGDEVFLQTLVYNSDFKHKLYKSDLYGNYIQCLREIYFEGVNPYIFRVNDFNRLVLSENLFARKFSSRIDNDIIINLYNYIVTK